MLKDTYIWKIQTKVKLVVQPLTPFIIGSRSNIITLVGQKKSNGLHVLIIHTEIFNYSLENDLYKNSSMLILSSPTKIPITSFDSHGS